MKQIIYIKKENISKIIKFKLLLYFSLLFGTFFLIYIIYFYHFSCDNEKKSNNILNSFNIEKLYSSSNYNVKKNNNSIFTIGIIEIPKINIKYPIWSTLNDNLLKTAPCRFFGPLPNEIGNLCIAAHNYDDNRFFGNLNKLNLGDSINIYSSDNQVITYFVYDKFESLKSDTSCILQNTNNKKEITLITCNNFNKKRLIIKAKE